MLTYLRSQKEELHAAALAVIEKACTFNAEERARMLARDALMLKILERPLLAQRAGTNFTFFTGTKVQILMRHISSRYSSAR